MIHLTKFMSLNFINEERIIQHHVLLVETPLSLSLSLSYFLYESKMPFLHFSLSLSHTKIVNESLPIPTLDIHSPPPLSVMFIYIRLSVYLC